MLKTGFLILVILFFITLAFILFLYMIIYAKGEADLTEINNANRNLSGYSIYFWGWVIPTEKSIEDFVNNSKKFTWVSPTWYYVDGKGNIIERAFDKKLIEVARENNVKILPLIANKGFDPNIVNSIVRNKEIGDRVIDALLKIVVEKNFDGINIDFEGIPSSDREYFTDFMKRLYLKFHEYGKLVSIDVPAKTHEVYEGWSGAFDYKALSNYTDLFIIMIYDYHWSGGTPGPISPLDWFISVLDYAVSNVPRKKIVAGIPFYGYDWPMNARGRGVTYEQAITIAKKYGAKVHFDFDKGEAHFTYNIVLERHEVWFNIAKSTELRIKTALEKGIDKTAAWRIGQEDPKTWKVIERH